MPRYPCVGRIDLRHDQFGQPLPFLPQDRVGIVPVRNLPLRERQLGGVRSPIISAGHRSNQAPNEFPHPHDDFACGFLMEKPDSCRPST